MNENGLIRDGWDRKPDPKHDCGHVCCDERDNPHHDHFLVAYECARCLAGPHDATLSQREVLAELRARLRVAGWLPPADVLLLREEIARLKVEVRELRREV